MKKLLLVILALSLMTPLCFAATKDKKDDKKAVEAPVAAPVAKAPIVRPATRVAGPTAVGKDVGGKLTMITPGDAAKGIRPKIEVTDNAGKKVTVDVAPGTRMFTVDRQKATLDKFKKNDKVFVTYSERISDGTRTAKTLNMVK